MKFSSEEFQLNSKPSDNEEPKQPKLSLKQRIELKKKPVEDFRLEKPTEKAKIDEKAKSFDSLQDTECTNGTISSPLNENSLVQSPTIIIPARKNTSPKIIKQTVIANEPVTVTHKPKSADGYFDPSLEIYKKKQEKANPNPKTEEVRVVTPVLIFGQDSGSIPNKITNKNSKQLITTYTRTDSIVIAEYMGDSDLQETENTIELTKQLKKR